nr:class II aldolase/adducin family protein [uncultured Oscillibacter sp.]
MGANSYDDIRKELTNFCRIVYEKGYTQASGGNLSCRVPGTDYFAIKRTGVNMRIMTERDVLIIDSEGTVIDGEGKPSKEVNFHLGIMKLRPEVNAVIHCHPCYAIAFANNELALPHVTVTSRKVVGPVPWVPAAPAGSPELRDYVVAGFRRHPESKAILMKEHGICAVGATLEAAFNIADLVEQTAFQAYLQIQIAKDQELYSALAL